MTDLLTLFSGKNKEDRSDHYSALVSHTLDQLLVPPSGVTSLYAALLVQAEGTRKIKVTTHKEGVSAQSLGLC